jgi:hypothetical protein
VIRTCPFELRHNKMVTNILTFSVTCFGLQVKWNPNSVDREGERGQREVVRGGGERN